MIYFFLNIIMYLANVMFLLKFFHHRMNMNSFLLLLFNINVSFVFIYQNINFLYGMMVSVISLVFYYFYNYFTNNSREIILIKEGNINFHELINNYSYSKLVNYLKVRRINLDEIAYCIKKNNNLVIIKNKNINYPISIIVDGKIMEENLKLINKDKDWLKRKLLEKHLLTNNIDYAYFKKNKLYFINN